MATRALTKLRKLCLALPEAREVEAWGSPTFRVKTIFAMYAEPGNHHGAGREGVWVKALKTNQELMVAAAPDRFFVPPYVGPSGWIGVYLDSAGADWDELRELLHDAWRMSAPKKLVAQHEPGHASTKQAPSNRAPTRKPRTKQSQPKRSQPRKSPAAKTTATKRPASNRRSS